MYHSFIKSVKKAAVLCLAVSMMAGAAVTSYAGPSDGIPDAARPAQTANVNPGSGSKKIDTSLVAQPVLSCEGAALYDVTHGQFLFEKNGNKQFYPASITKVMTALLVDENANMNDIVTFSHEAVTNLETGAVTLYSVEGDKVPLRDCMYGLLLKSANEVANALGEHVAGSISGFVNMMNQRAASLGCTNTHFSNTNGLNSSTHLTTPHDYALITAAAYSRPNLQTISSTYQYRYPATASQGERLLTMGHKMVNPNGSEKYNGFICGKTGYTSKAGNTLVSVAERNGVRLVAVVLKSNQTHYADTRKMFDYGFALMEKNGISTGSSAQNTGTNQALPTQNNQSVQNNQTSQNGGQMAVSPVDSNNSANTGNAQNVVNTQTGNSSSPSADIDANSGTKNDLPGKPAESLPAETKPVESLPAETKPAETQAAVQSQSSPGNQSAQADTYPTVSGKWVDLGGNDWKFTLSTGETAANTTLTINGAVYSFGSDGKMLKGWQLVNNKWHYFSGSSGAMKLSKWIQTNNMWYYVDQAGALFVNGTTPDGYKVDQNGVWVQ